MFGLILISHHSVVVTCLLCRYVMSILFLFDKCDKFNNTFAIAPGHIKQMAGMCQEIEVAKITLQCPVCTCLKIYMV